MKKLYPSGIIGFFALLFLTLLSKQATAQTPNDVFYQDANGARWPQEFTFYTGTSVSLTQRNSGGAIPPLVYGTTTAFASGVGTTENGTTGNPGQSGYVSLGSDKFGNLFVSDQSDFMIKEVSTGGSTSTYAGNTGVRGNANGTTSGSTYNLPAGIAVDASGNVYVSNYGANVIKKISTAGIVTTFAGTGATGSADGNGNVATFNKPVGLAVDASGNVYVADQGSGKIRMITPAGVVSTYAGSGSTSSTDGYTTSAGINNPTGIAIDGSGRIYITEYLTGLIRMIDNTGFVNTIAAVGSVNGIYSTGTPISFVHPTAVAADAAGNVYITELVNSSSYRLRKMAPFNSNRYSDITIPNYVTTLMSTTVPMLGVATDASGYIYVKFPSAITKITGVGYSMPLLPAGLNLNYTTGVISGTPTTVKALTAYPFSVFNKSGNYYDTLYFSVKQAEPKPVITSFNPTTAKPGDSVIISGNNFATDVSLVTIGTQSVPYHVNSTTKITAYLSVPLPSTFASGAVTVTNPGGGTTSLGGFIYTKYPQHIIFTAIPAQVYGAADLPAQTYYIEDHGYQLYSDVSNPLTLTSSNTAVAQITANGIHIVGIGTSTITATQAGDNQISAATAVSQVLTINKAPQTLTFSKIPSRYIGSADFNPGAFSSSNLGVTYTTSNANVATIVNGNIHIAAAGSVTITASQAGTTTYLAATPVSQTFQVLPLPLAPNTTYATPKIYPVGTAITALAPSGSTHAPSTTQYGQATALASFATGGALLNYSVTPNIYNPGDSITNVYSYVTAVDTAGNIYVGDGANNVVRKITATGAISVFAGSGAHGAANGAGATASFGSITGIATDAAGNVYVADAGNSAIRKITPAGLVSTLDVSGYLDLYSTTINVSAILSTITAIAVDNYNNIYFNAAGSVYQLNVANKLFIQLSSPMQGNIDYHYATTALAVDAAGNVYFSFYNTIIKISNGAPVLLAGNNNVYSSVDGTGASAGFYNINGLTVDAAGNLFATESDANHKYLANHIRKITPAGVVTTIAGAGAPGSADGPGTSATFNQPFGIAADGAGNVYVGDAGNNLVRKLVLNGYFLNTQLPAGLSFTGTTGTISGTPLKAAAAANYKITANNTTGGSKTNNVNIAVTALAAPAISYVGPKTYTTGTTIGTLKPTYTGGAIPAAIYGQTTTFINRNFFVYATDAGIDHAGNIYVLDGVNSGAPAVKKITPAGVATTIATASQLGNSNYTGSLTVDSIGNIYMLTGNYPYTIRRIAPGGQMSNIAVPSYIQNGIPHLAADAKGNIYMASLTAIYKITSNGTTSVLAGSDIALHVDGTGTDAGFSQILSFTADGAGNVYVIDDSGDYAAIRMITPAGVVTTIAGGVSASPTVDGIGSAATFDFPRSITTDGAGNLYLLDNLQLRKIAPGGMVSTIGESLGVDNVYNQSIMADGSGNIFSLIYNGIQETFVPGFTINPGLPAGLSFSTTNGAISGTPTQASPSTVYNISVYNSSAGATAKLTIKVNSTVAPPVIAYTGSSVFTAGGAIAPLSPVNTGGAIPAAGYAILPALPAGLSFNNNTGIISGTPAGPSANISYTITATNSGGSSTFLQSIAIVNAITTTSYQQTLAYPVNRPITPVNPTNSGPAITQAVYGQNVVLAGGVSGGKADGIGSAASFNQPQGLVTDTKGNIYLEDLGNYRVRKITPIGTVSTIAGNNFRGYVNGKGSAASLAFTYPLNIGADTSGNLYMANVDNNGNGVIRKIGPDSSVSTLSTNIYATALTADASGNVYTTDGRVIRKTYTYGGVYYMAGNANSSQLPQADGYGANASFNSISAMTIDNAGNLYVIDQGGYNFGTYEPTTIRKITPDGYVTTLPGSLPYDWRGSGIAVDNAGNVFVTNTNTIKEISSGNINEFYSSDNSYIGSIAIDPTGHYLYATNNNQVLSFSVSPNGANYNIAPALPPGLNFDAATGVISGTPTVVSPVTKYTVNVFNNGTGSAAALNLSVYLPAPDISYVTPQTFPFGTAIVPLSPTNNGGDVDPNATVSTYAGTGTPYWNDGPVSTAYFYNPSGLATDKQGNMYVSDSYLGYIRKISPDGIVSTLAGSGSRGNANGVGTAATFSYPAGLTVDPAGNIYVADGGNNVIRKIAPDGTTTTYAGSGKAGSGGSTTIIAKFNGPTGVAIDKSGNLFVADQLNSLIRKITPAGAVSTFGSASPAFRYPSDVVIDQAGNLFVADKGNGMIRKITSAGVVSTVATGLSGPMGITIDTFGNLYVSDSGDIKKVSQSGVITIVAGNGTGSYQNGTGSNAAFNTPAGLTADTLGNIYVADQGNNRIRKVGPSGYNLRGSLPAGLVFDPATGIFSGTPTASVPATDHQVFAFNSSGVDSTVVNIGTTASQTITFAALNPVLYGSADITPVASSTNSTIPIVFNSSNTDVATIVAGKIHLTGIGTSTITASQAGNASFSPALNVSRTLTVTQAKATITFAATKSVAFNSADFVPVAQSTNTTVPITYSSSDTTIATIVNGYIHIIKTGTVTIVASQAGNTTYNPASNVYQTLTIAPAVQTIIFPAITKTYGDADADPGAVATSGLPVSYITSDSTIAKIINSKLHILKAGSVTITASQAGNANFLAAKNVALKITIAKEAQTITFNSISPAVYLTTVPLSAISTSGLGVSFTSSDTLIAKVSGSTIQIKGIGTVTITANQPSSSSYSYLAATPVAQTITTVLAPQTITFAAPASKVFGTADYALSATSSSKLPVTFSSADTTIATIISGKVHIIAAGTVNITATQGGSSLYQPATAVTQPLTITKAPQVLVFSAITAKTYGAADFATTITGAKLPLTLSSSNTAVATIVNGLIHITGTGTTTITASQAGNNNYSAATPVTQLLTVNKAALTITATSQTKVYGTVNPTLAVTYTGLVYGETYAVLGKLPLIGTTATTSSSFGSYPITDSAAVAANYAITYKAGLLTITKAPQTITFNPIPAAAYGTTVPLTATSTSGLVVTFTSSDTLIAKVSSSGILVKGIGTVTITASQASGSSYNYLAATPVSQTITTVKDPQTITFAAPVSKVFGTADYALSASATSKLPVTFSSADTTIATIISGKIHIVSAGTVNIIANQAGNSLYQSAQAVTQPLTITKAPQTLTFGAITAKTYGAADFATTISGAKLPISLSSSNTAVATIVNGLIHITGTGTATITASQAGNNNYSAATPVTQLLTVNKAALTIAATSQTKVYGTVNPTLTVTYTGFVYGETYAVLTKLPLIGTTATTSSSFGSYPITDSAAVAANYTITYKAGVLTITKAPQTITFNPIPAAAYGTTVPLTAISTSKLVVTFTSSDTLIAKVSSSGILVKGIGTVTITASQASGSSYNYLAATPVSQTITTVKAPQTITFAALLSKAYGTADYALSASATSKLPVTFTSADTTIAKVTGSTLHIVSAGTVNIIANQSGSSLYLPATTVMQPLTITKAPQTLTFGAITAKAYGVADFATTISGAKLPLTLSSSNTAVATIVNGLIHITGAGTATITASQAGNNNYSAATPVTQLLTVNKAALTIAATSKSKVYGSANPTLAVTYTGFVYGETSAVLTKLPLIGTTATTLSPIGSYPITDSLATAANYNITYKAGVLTVTQSPQTVTFNPIPAAAYGTTVPLTATATSGLTVTFASSDTTIAKISSGGMLIKGVGAVTITANQLGGSKSNYLAATPVTQTITTLKAPQTITFNAPLAKIYGVADYALSASATSKLPVTFSSSNSAVATIVNGLVHITGAGTTVITATQVGSGIYLAAQVVTQTLTVNQAPLRISVANQTKTAGAANPLFTVTYTGFVKSETVAVITTLPTITTTATTTSPAGSYPITASGAVAANYAITYVPGTLTVKAAQTKAIVINTITDVPSNKPQTDALSEAAPNVVTAISADNNGINDVLTIEHIEKFPDNTISLIDLNGTVVYHLSHYDNVNRVFDGHSNITGKLQHAGTYYYKLDYKDNGITKSKTGYIVLKY